MCGVQELDTARVAERNAVLKADRLEAELEYYKTPKFVEMDMEVLMHRSEEIAAIKVMYDMEISSRVKKLMVESRPTVR